MELTDKKIEIIEMVLAPHPFGRIEDMTTMLEGILTRGVTVDELQQYIVNRKKEHNAKIAAVPEGRIAYDLNPDPHPPIRGEKPNVKKCSECQSDMFLRQVTRPEGPQNTHGYKSAWECSKCSNEIYSTRTSEEEYKATFENS